jgi:hypothetical protein
MQDSSIRIARSESDFLYSSASTWKSEVIRIYRQALGRDLMTGSQFAAEQQTAADTE